MHALIKSSFLIAAAAMGGTTPPGGDVVLSALDDELARSKNSLVLTGHEKPFLIEYGVRDSDSFTATASFGALSGESCGRSRSLNTQVLLGDYKLNSAKNAFGIFEMPTMRFFGSLSHAHLNGTPLPIDDNYFALRRAIWRDTDTKYKTAVENFAAKKAYMVSNQVADRPDDLSIEAPVVSLNPIGKLSVDKAQWQKNVKDWSGIFRNYPHIQRSFVAFAAAVENRWYVNSEGFKNRTSRPTSMVCVMATANRDDGSRAADCQFIVADTADHLPKPADLEKGIRELADRVEQLRNAKPIAEEYDGPVLLEGEAAAQFLADTLAPNLGSSGENQGFGFSKNQWREKLGLKVLPPFISVIDDPTARQYGDKPIYGSRELDDDGMRAEKLTLVDHGVLKTFCMSRMPTRQLSKSNGHSVGGVGSPSNLFVVADHPMTASQLREKLIEEGKEQGLKYVYVFRRMTNVMSSVVGGNGLENLGMGASALPPLCAYQVSTADGHEELVRDVYFSHFTTRILRDIEAASDDSKAYNPLTASVAGCLVTPSLLIKEVELQKRTGKPTKNEPILDNPYFERKK